MKKITSKYAFPEKEFEKFFKQYYKLALLISVRITNDLVSSEDIVQDIFLSMWENPEINLFDPKLKSYLLTSVKNRSLNYIRDKKEHIDLELCLDEKHSNEYDFEKDEKISQILLEIEKLPPRCREIFNLVVFKQYKYSEVASKLNISNNTVKTQLSAAYKQLRKIYYFFF